MWFINLGVDVIDVVDEAVRCQSLPSFHLIIMLWALIVAILLQRNTSSSTGKGMYRSRAILIKRHTLSAFTVLVGIIFPDIWFLPFVLWFSVRWNWRKREIGDERFLATWLWWTQKRYNVPALASLVFFADISQLFRCLIWITLYSGFHLSFEK